MTEKQKTVNIDISKKVFNEVYLHSLEDTTRTQIFFGGSSSGKSFFILAQRVIWDLIKGGRNYLILRNVARYSRISTFNEVKKGIEYWKVGYLFKVLESTMTITNMNNGYQIIFGGLNDVEKLKSITPEKGVITDIIIEEATETQYEDIKQLAKRLRGKSEKKKRLVLLFNPILKSHWIYKEYFSGNFFDNDICYKDDKLFILKTTYKDNKFLEKEDIAELEDETDEYFYDVYTLGNWGTLGDVIFKNWRVEDLSSIKSQFDNIKNGVDFGFGADPFTYNRMHYDGKRKKIYIFKEHHEHELTNPQIADVLLPIVNKEIVTCDSAEPKSIKELRNCGVNARGAIKGKDSINHGIQFIRQHEVIIDKNCQETINEFELYHWKKNSSGETLNIPVDRNNHHCFVGDTLVMTKRGNIRIDSLKDSDKVLTRHGYKNIVWHKKTRNTETSKVIFSDGTKIECVKTHRFITNQNKKKSLYLLTKCDMLMKNKGGILQWLVNQLFTTATSIGEAKQAKIQNISKESIKERLSIFIGRFMKIILDQSQVGMKSIMLMATPWIIHWKTSSVYQGNIINLNIEVNAQRHKKTTLIGSGILQKNGTQVKKEENGILNTGKSRIKKESQFKKHALYAKKSFKTFQDLIKQDFVQTTANQNIEEFQELTIYKRFVNFVEKCLLLINTDLLKRVHVVAVTDTGQKKDVYNLQVDSDLHEYYANGMLVANCDSIRYGLENDMVSLRATPRVSIVSDGKKKIVTPNKPIAKPGEQIIEIWEGDQIVGFEKIIGGGNIPRGGIVGSLGGGLGR